MSQDRLTKMECTECHTIGHYTQKNKKKLHNAGKLVLNKTCKICHKHTKHTETK